MFSLLSKLLSKLSRNNLYSAVAGSCLWWSITQAPLCDSMLSGSQHPLTGVEAISPSWQFTTAHSYSFPGLFCQKNPPKNCLSRFFMEFPKNRPFFIPSAPWILGWRTHTSAESACLMAFEWGTTSCLSTTSWWRKSYDPLKTAKYNFFPVRKRVTLHWYEVIEKLCGKWSFNGKLNLYRYLSFA